MWLAPYAYAYKSGSKNQYQDKNMNFSRRNFGKVLEHEICFEFNFSQHKCTYFGNLQSIILL